MKELIIDLWLHFKTQLVTLIVLMVIIGAFEGIGIVIFLPFISMISGEIIPQTTLTIWILEMLELIFGARPTSLQLVGVIIAIFSIQTLLLLSQGRLAANLESTYVDRYRSQLLLSMLHARWGFFIKNKVGKLLYTFESETERLGRAFILLTQIASIAILAMIYSLISFYLCWQFTLFLTFLTFVGFLILTRHFGRVAFQNGSSYAEHSRNLLNHVNEFLLSAKLIKSTNSEEQAFRICEKLLVKLKKDYYGAVFYPYALRSILEFFLFSGICFSLFLMSAQGISLSSMIVLTAIFLRLLPKIQVAQTSYQMLLNFLPNFKNVKLQLNVANECAEEVTYLNESLDFKAPVTITFENIMLQYKENIVLKDVSFEIPSGAICAIVGPSGAGKSSLVDILAKIVQADEGSVYIDHVKLKDIPSANWRRRIGYVTQEPLVLNESIYHNITWGMSNYTQRDVEHASKLANADSFIRTLPEGYDTIVGERGNRLSGGQKQRIVLARALLSKPVLLILDEATSALDEISEQAFIETLQYLRGQITILLISHRLGPVKIADKVIYLEDGRVAKFMKNSLTA